MSSTPRTFRGERNQRDEHQSIIFPPLDPSCCPFFCFPRPPSKLAEIHLPPPRHKQASRHPFPDRSPRQRSALDPLPGRCSPGATRPAPCRPSPLAATGRLPGSTCSCSAGDRGRRPSSTTTPTPGAGSRCDHPRRRLSCGSVIVSVGVKYSTVQSSDVVVSLVCQEGTKGAGYAVYSAHILRARRERDSRDSAVGGGGCKTLYTRRFSGRKQGDAFAYGTEVEIVRLF